MSQHQDRQDIAVSTSYKHDIEKEKNLFNSRIKALKRSFGNGERFVLFVGAGQNAGDKVKLLWNHLIREVSKTSFGAILREFGESQEDVQAIMEAMGIVESKSTSDPAKKEEGKEDDGKQDDEKQGNDNNDKNKKDADNKIPKNWKLNDYIRTHFPVEIQVSMIKNLMKDHYIPSLQKYLYNECNYKIIKTYFSDLYSLKDHNRSKNKESQDKEKKKELHTLFTIARMILLNPQIDSVITYNFDNFLRQAIKVLVKSPERYFTAVEIKFLEQRYSLFGKEGSALADRIKVQDVHDNEFDSLGNIPVGTFPVYHVHGYIPDPHEEEIVNTPDIVMALEEFVEQQTEGLSWQDAVQVKAFRDSNIIFIGCSMTDLTMKRMINFAHSCGYQNKIYIMDAIKDGDDDINLLRRKRILNKLRRRYFESLGAIYICCPNGFGELCEALQEITYVNLKEQYY